MKILHISLRFVLTVLTSHLLNPSSALGTRHTSSAPRTQTEIPAPLNNGIDQNEILLLTPNNHTVVSDWVPLRWIVGTPKANVKYYLFVRNLTTNTLLVDYFEIPALKTSYGLANLQIGHQYEWGIKAVNLFDPALFTITSSPFMRTSPTGHNIGLGSLSKVRLCAGEVVSVPYSMSGYNTSTLRSYVTASEAGVLSDGDFIQTSQAISLIAMETGENLRIRTCVVQDGLMGCSSPSQAFVVGKVDSVSVVNAAGSPTSLACAGTSVKLSAHLHGNVNSQPLSYYWLKNGCERIAGANDSTLTVQEEGRYQAVVTSESGCASLSPEHSVKYSTSVTPTLETNQLDGFRCSWEGAFVKTNVVGSENTYTWRRNGTQLSVPSQPVLSITEPGTYEVTITGPGCSATAPPIEVKASPGIALTIRTNDPSVCANQPQDAYLFAEIDQDKLYSNIDWTQRANFLEIPTDCPQRDERLAWTGDAQIYIRSAAYNRDVAAFFTKWMVDLNDAQWNGGPYDGAYPLYAPRPNVRGSDSYSPGWMEAGIICPYEIYRTYGDTRILAKSWPNMVRFMNFLEQHSQGKYLFPENSFKNIYPNGGFGDWLSLGKKTSPDLLASMYFGYCARLMAEMAEALDKPTDTQRFRTMYSKVQDALQAYYSNNNGKLFANESAYGTGDGYVHDGLGFTGHSQTAYANALYMEVIPESMRSRAGAYLAEQVEQNGGKMTIGFLGAKQLLPALSQAGRSDIAYRLFLSEGFPSWGFEVRNGATTIWERWDSKNEQGGFTGNGVMNSFSHYAFGAVCEWMFEYAAGIQPLAPGFKSIRIRPEIAPTGLNYLRATYQTPHGNVLSSWTKQGQNLTMDVTIPVNTTAEIHIPMTNAQTVLEAGQPVTTHTQWKVKGIEKGYLVLEAGSGNYHFTSQVP